MTPKAATALEKSIHNDGSLSEERKAALLLLVSTMTPEMSTMPTPQENAKGTNRTGKQSKEKSGRRKPQQKTLTGR